MSLNRKIATDILEFWVDSIYTLFRFTVSNGLRTEEGSTGNKYKYIAEAYWLDL